MICSKCGQELSGPDDTHLCRPMARDIIEAATPVRYDGKFTIDYDVPGTNDTSAFRVIPELGRFISTFDSTHVGIMLHQEEATRQERDLRCGLRADARGVCRMDYSRPEQCIGVDACAALARLDELRGKS